MLDNLNIKNIALIEQLNIEIRSGMTVLTGETGAGKSIIIDAVNLLLGARTNKTLVRYGCSKAMVQGLFTVSDNIAKALEEQGIEPEENSLIVTREITADGKSTARISGVMVTQNVLREIGATLINIHGQQDNQALLNPSKHIDFLDEYAKTDISVYSALFDEMKELKSRIDALSKNESERIQRIDLLKYQTDEIEKAKLQPGEKEELEDQRNIIANAEKIAQAVGEAYTVLYEDNSAYDAISRAVSALAGVSGFDENLDDVLSRLTDTMYVIEDGAHELRSYADDIDFDENTLNEIEERLDLITKLERKYGGSVEKVLEFYERAVSELEQTENADETTAELKKQLNEVMKKLEKEAKNITNVRKSAAEKLEKEIEISLSELDMPKVRFAVAVEQADDFLKNGADKVEFLICPNVGEQMKPLAAIASGGELSRVMLAVKSIIGDSVDTLIFDEIDTGVSGSAALKIAEKLSKLAEDKQIICVSHQPQLAAKADNHFKICKTDECGRTVTHISVLSDDERIMEIARIIDGDNLTETAVKHAKEMLKK
ncbi:MAG: DNA repair protein RecN [Firmicutes bacterium]|nr:DNA repair protein RecN [Bacillota bacterium]